MRTIVTIEDRLVEALKRNAQKEGRPFKEVVNEVLRAGVHARSHPSPQPYQLEPASMDQPQPGYELAKAHQISDELEDRAVTEKLEQRKRS